jgi:hypothetical protein
MLIDSTGQGLLESPAKQNRIENGESFSQSLAVDTSQSSVITLLFVHSDSA